MPFPVEQLRFFDNASPAAGPIQASAADAQNTDASPPVPGVRLERGAGLGAGGDLAAAQRR